MKNILYKRLIRKKFNTLHTPQMTNQGMQRFLAKFDEKEDEQLKKAEYQDISLEMLLEKAFLAKKQAKLLVRLIERAWLAKLAERARAKEKWDILYYKLQRKEPYEPVWWTEEENEGEENEGEEIKGEVCVICKKITQTDSDNYCYKCADYLDFGNFSDCSE